MFDAQRKRPWLILVGPTSVGKTKVAELLASELKTDILTADSRQVYQEMNIGTNKPTQEEQKLIKRALIDLVPPDTPFTVGKYTKEAKSVISTLEEANKPIVIEGGTGLYIKALLYGLWEGPPGDRAFRQTFLDLEQIEGAGTVHRKLSEVDPISAAKIHFRDVSKIARALEVFHVTGRPLSELHTEHRLLTQQARSFVMIGFRREKPDLYRRIEARIDQQFQDGLVLETKQLLERGFSLECSSMRALGYKQIIPYLEGKQTLEETISIVKQETRHYAKRQMTWFSADPNIVWIDLKADELPEKIFNRMKNLNCWQGMV